MEFSHLFPQVRHLYICDFHKNFIQSVRNKRKRKTSDDGGESPDHDVEVPEVTASETLIIIMMLKLCCPSIQVSFLAFDVFHVPHV